VNVNCILAEDLGQLVYDRKLQKKSI